MKIQINQYKLAKTFLLIPIIVTIVIIISLLVANVLEGPTNRGIIYSIFALIGILGIFFAPLLCFIISTIGTIFAIRVKSRSYLIIGVFEIIFFIICVCFSIIMFINGQSV